MFTAQVVSYGSESLCSLVPQCQNGEYKKLALDSRIPLALFKSLSASDYVTAQRFRRRFMHYHMEIFKKVDVIVTPTTGMIAPMIHPSALSCCESDLEVTGNLMKFAVTANVLGFPAISVPIWDGNTVSRCFDNLMLGFGANMITFVIIVVHAITERTTRGRRRIHLYEKVFLLVLPIIGAFLACFDLVMLLTNTRNGRTVLYHEWLVRCSQLLVWTSILLVSRFGSWLFVLSNRVLCFWWIMKPVLAIPTLHAVFSSLEVISCINESLIVLVDVLFGVLINIIRIKQTSRRNSSMEESLLSFEMGIDDHFESNPGVLASFWNLMTFKSINPVMEHGSKKQLDFNDLLQLPTDMVQRNSLTSMIY